MAVSSNSDDEQQSCRSNNNNDDIVIILSNPTEYMYIYVEPEVTHCHEVITCPIIISLMNQLLLTLFNSQSPL